jgi:hypothetical protein
MKELILKVLPVADIILTPVVYPAAWLLKQIRRAGVHRLPHCRTVLMKLGVFPILNHYYEPQFDNRSQKQDFSQERALPGIDFNITEQLSLIDDFKFAHELDDIHYDNHNVNEYYLNNDAFVAGDAEYWYQLIRTLKPKRIFEVGSGYSTLLAVKAIRKNKEEKSSYTCEHVCIEPYEMSWLETLDVSVIRSKVEDVDVSLFYKLEENDILFIDSSHIIRPQGDVLFEYLELLPMLNKGVIVHIHDIFSPRNYPREWLVDEIRFWNEQYLLEAFLTHNSKWKIIGALNLLHHTNYAKLKAVAPYLTPESEPGSFYIRKID